MVYQGRLKIGDQFLKIGSQYLRIGSFPNIDYQEYVAFGDIETALASGGAALVRVENMTDEPSLSGSDLSITQIGSTADLRNNVADDPYYVKFYYCYATGASPSFTPTDVSVVTGLWAGTVQQAAPVDSDLVFDAPGDGNPVDATLALGTSTNIVILDVQFNVAVGDATRIPGNLSFFLFFGSPEVVPPGWSVGDSDTAGITAPGDGFGNNPAAVVAAVELSPA